MLNENVPLPSNSENKADVENGFVHTVVVETGPDIPKQSRYKNYQQVYTVGSKEDSKVGCAVISDNYSNMQCIPDDSSIFTAEAKAVDLALDFIRTCDTNNKFIIFSDSLSVLKAMNHTSSKNPQIQKL